MRGWGRLTPAFAQVPMAIVRHGAGVADLGSGPDIGPCNVAGAEACSPVASVASYAARRS